MPCGGARNLGDRVSVGLSDAQRADGSTNSLRRLLTVHERRVDHERGDARRHELGKRCHQIELDAVVEVAAAERIGDDGEIEILAVLQVMRAATAAALGAILVARALAHEQAVLGNHELLRA